jgi:hypothetical protein
VILAFAVLSMAVTAVSIATTDSTWATVVNTFLLIILTVIANRNRGRAKQAADSSHQASIKIDQTRERLEDGYVDKVAQAAADTIIGKLEEAGVFGRRRPANSLKDDQSPDTK